MRAGGYTLGGEQSGHVIMLDHATTGDGLLTALHVLARMAETGTPLAELAAVMVRLPQVLVNVAGRRQEPRSTTTRCSPAVAPRRSAELGDAGRVLLRPAAPSRCVRVMVEAPTPRVRPAAWPTELAAVVRSVLR